MFRFELVIHFKGVPEVVVGQDDAPAEE